MPTTRDRVPAHTADEINQRIERETEARIRHLARAPHGIPARLAELDAEWDIERAIETNASIIAFTGVVLGAFVHPYWLVLPALVTAFLFQHAIQGWCPPVPVLRRLGFRTADEISEERQALKAIRGDFEDVAAAEDKASAALAAART
ncbi:MAG: DUF2892 domain-containing protein [Hyphomicrobium sp.]|nr:DUF2892 domain-containing protein [Hyphomicrobium sp.]